MRRNHRKTRRAFTLLELMLAIAVIGILMSMLGAAAYSARQRAYVTLATAETQQIASAFKSYYLANHKWPGKWENGASDTLTRQNLAPIIGSEGTVYLDISDFRFEGDAFLDPWGHPYTVTTRKIDQPEVSDTIEGAISFPNQLRHYYEEGIYDRPDSRWPWDEYRK